MARRRGARTYQGPRPYYEAGRMPRSQAVTTYGVGSIYEMRTHRRRETVLHSVMIAGLDFWPQEDLELVREPTLEQALGVRHFLRPPGAEDGPQPGPYIPAVRFPRWHVCTHCRRLGRVPDEFEDRAGSGPRCRATGCGGRGTPARLVTACFATGDGGDDGQPGHIDDFPWARWAHSDRGPTCPRPQLRLETVRNTTSLSGLVVRCHSRECGGRVQRSLEGVFGEHALAFLKCRGSRPWLGDTEEGCARKVRALLRGASNVYFPVIASAISIPPSSDRLVQLIAHRAQAVVRSVGIEDITVVVHFVRNALPEAERYSDEEIATALAVLAQGRGDAPAASERAQRSSERKAILRGRNEDRNAGEFVAVPVPAGQMPSPLSRYLASLVQVHRLREVRVLRGFQRITPSGALDQYQAGVAPLARGRTEWLPAIDVKGEGVFIELDPGRVAAWEQSAAVGGRMDVLRTNWKRARTGAGGGPEPAPEARFILVHTLAHLLIKQLALECGYSSSSLAERLYVGRDGTADEELGLLIYTAQTGADGTLGGLVRLGDPVPFQRTLLGALEGAVWCSSDPLCMESRGQGFDALNLAACHACCLVSETSCEQRNTLLDRALLVGTPAAPGVGFFCDLLQGH